MSHDLPTAADLISATDGLRESSTEWWLDSFAVLKSDSYRSWQPRPPSYRRGWTFALAESAHLASVPFVRNSGEPAIAVMWLEPGAEYFVAWFPTSRAAEAQRAVERLNAEIRGVWDHWRNVRPTADAPAADAGRELRFEEGHEYAPDARWGLQVLTLDNQGRYTYDQRRAGRSVRTGAGTVDTGRARAVFADLARSTFPEVAKRPFPPGASVVTIALTPDRRVALDRWHGSELEGYREAIATLLDLIAEARVAAENATEPHPER